ncbi:MAG: hypothetical protein B7733_13655 [Myxococcales bacterium FL481]|nr:MAG: hypothetical protein B7733_13655 [Myxococcales bacterium FL481]
MTRTHRVRGATRSLERFGEDIFDAVSRLPTAKMAFFPAGAQLRIRIARSERIDPEAFGRIVRVVVSAMTKA